MWCEKQNGVGLDWMLPEAWDVEHNNLHHYKLGETTGDPDLVERNMAPLRQGSLPMLARYGGALHVESS